MDAWLKKGVEFAQAAEQNVNKLQKKATKLTQDVLMGADSSRSLKDVEFLDGPLGFTLDGIIVMHVEPGSQAERLGVEAFDKLVQVAGYKVPKFKPGDVAGEQRAAKLAQQWLDEMPRPGSLTFAPPRPAEEEIEFKIDGDVFKAVVVRTRPAAEDPEHGLTHEIRYTSGHSGKEWVCLDEEQEVMRDAYGHDGIPYKNLTKLAEKAEDELIEASMEPADVSSTEGETPKIDVPTHEHELGNPGFEECQKLLAHARASLEAEKRKNNKLLEELGAARARNKELLSNATTREKDNDSAMEAAEARERALEADIETLRQKLEAAEGCAERERAIQSELTRLRQDLSEATQRAKDAEAEIVELKSIVGRLTSEVDDLTAQVSAADSRTAASEERGALMDRELRGFRDAHDAELDLLREECCAKEQSHSRRLEELTQQAAADVEHAKCEAEELRDAMTKQQAQTDAAVAEAQAAVVEATAARRAAIAAEEEAKALRAQLTAALQRASSGSGGTHADTSTEDSIAEADEEAALPLRAVSSPAAVGSSEDTAALQQRIDLLEKRCVTLQRKLNSQLLSATGTQAGVGQSHPVWLPWVTSFAGPRAGEISVLAYSVPDKAFRNFTQRLLKRNAWLWIFYVHLFLLYTLTAACYIQASPDASSPIESLNEKLARKP